MSAKYSFHLQSRDKRRNLPARIVIGRNTTETVAHVLLKLMGYLLFHRERVQVEANLHIDSIPYVPDIVQLDYALQPVLWVECGECAVAKLHKLAVKVPEAEIWVLKRSEADAQALFQTMSKLELRRNRYNLVGLDAAMFDELCALLKSRNEVLWVGGEFDPPNLRFDFNGLWFDAPFVVLRF